MPDRCTPLVSIEVDGTSVRFKHAYLLHDPVRRDYWSVVLTGVAPSDAGRLSTFHHIVARLMTGEIVLGQAWVEAGESPERIRLIGSGIPGSLFLAA